MPQTFLTFDFGSDEEAVQSARHQLDAWKQAFRPGNKVEFKIERRGAQEGTGYSPANDSQKESGGAKPKGSTEKDDRLRIIVRLDFSAHERQLYRTWLERIERDQVLKSAKYQITERGGEQFDKISELFRSLG